MKMERIPKQGEFYRHFKNKLYQITAVAEHTETGEFLVVYQALYGDFRIFARPLSMFTSKVDREKYPDAAQEYRFERVEPGTMEDLFGEKPEERQAEPELKPNPWLVRFLDAESLEERLGLLYQMRGKISQRELDSLYTVLDAPRVQGDAEEQLLALEQLLRTQMKYDGGRLR